MGYTVHGICFFSKRHRSSYRRLYLSKSQYSPFTFAKSQLNGGYVSLMAYNVASIIEEGGVRASFRTAIAVKRKFKRRWTIERLLKRV